MTQKSPSSRRAWIEINYKWSDGTTTAKVALLAEGVDRNVSREYSSHRSSRSPSSRRAWIEIQVANLPSFGQLSPSSRRAWIEICLMYPRLKYDDVALLAEGVDRNRARVSLM